MKISCPCACIECKNCPGDWLVGKDTGVTEKPEEVRVKSREACYKLCSDKQKLDSQINAATFGIATGSEKGKCLCEKGMTSADGSSDWISKYIQGFFIYLRCIKILIRKLFVTPISKWVYMREISLSESVYMCSYPSICVK